MIIVQECSYLERHRQQRASSGEAKHTERGIRRSTGKPRSKPATEYGADESSQHGYYTEIEINPLQIKSHLDPVTDHKCSHAAQRERIQNIPAYCEPNDRNAANRAETFAQIGLNLGLAASMVNQL